METPPSPCLPASTPHEPILVLGKKNDFLYPVQTVALAVTYTRRYLEGDGTGAKDPHMPQQGRLRLDELDFFDGLGRRLEPAVDADGTLVKLVVEPDHQVEIRNRVRELLSAARERLQEHPDASDLAKRLPAMPSDELSFDQFLHQIVNDEKLRFDPKQNCGFIEWICCNCR